MLAQLLAAHRQRKAQARLEKMVAANRTSFATIDFTRRRAAALRGSAILRQREEARGW